MLKSWYELEKRDYGGLRLTFAVCEEPPSPGRLRANDCRPEKRIEREGY